MFNKGLRRRLKLEISKRRQLKWKIEILEKILKDTNEDFIVLLNHLNLTIITTDAKPAKKVVVLRDGTAGPNSPLEAAHILAGATAEDLKRGDKDEQK